MVHPLGKRPRGWFGPEDYVDGDDIVEETAARARKQAAWDEIFYKMSWWKRLCCFLAGEVTEPMSQVPYAFFENKLQRQQAGEPAANTQSKENAMKNEELLHRHGSRLNSFTRTLREACIEQGAVLVKLRNGDLRSVKYMAADANDESFEHPYEDSPDGGFRGADDYHYWQANGESITGDQYDIISCEFPKRVGQSTRPTTAVTELWRAELESRIQAAYAAVPEYVRDDVCEATAWARATLTAREGTGHQIYVSAGKNGLVVCSFAKASWAGDHCGRGMAHGAEAIVMSVCEYISGA